MPRARAVAARASVNSIYITYVDSSVMETVTIPKSEYKKLKKLKEVDHELLIKIVKGLEDTKAGRIKKWE